MSNELPDPPLQFAVAENATSKAFFCRQSAALALDEQGFLSADPQLLSHSVRDDTANDSSCAPVLLAGTGADPLPPVTEAAPYRLRRALP